MLVFLLSGLAAFYLRLVGWTSSITWLNRSVRERLEGAGRGFIYAFWHGRQAFLVYLHQGDRILPLVSKSKDGEIIARVCRSFGLNAIRGSSSRGGSEALRELHSLVEDGARVGFTPDGPRGPLHSVQPGALFLAQITGAPIVPVAYGARRTWVFGSWDRFLVPKPFNRISMAYGEPLFVKPGDDMDAKKQQLKEALDQVTAQADAAVQKR